MNIWIIVLSIAQIIVLAIIFWNLQRMLKNYNKQIEILDELEESLKEGNKK